MNDMKDIPQHILNLSPFFGNWEIDAIIGVGRFGRVFRIKRKSFDHEQFSAMKWIPVPQNDAEVMLAKDSLNGNISSIRRHFEAITLDLEREIVLMERVQNCPNVVGYKDHYLYERQETDGIGFDLFIRMELLTPLPVRLAQPYTVGDVVNLGIDICKALIICQKERIIHRDIKPDNLFIGPDGLYRLGDFGIARQLNESISNMSCKGTPSYMAPEIYLGQRYDRTVDTYSLGLVLHRLLNRYRVPFAPQGTEAFCNKERENALMERLKGSPIPPPVEGFDAFNRILAKATSFSPKKRYQTAEQMLNALTPLLHNKHQTSRALTLQSNFSQIISSNSPPEMKDDKDSSPNPSSSSFKKKPDISPFVSTPHPPTREKAKRNQSGDPPQSKLRKRSVISSKSKKTISTHRSKSGGTPLPCGKGVTQPSSQQSGATGQKDRNQRIGKPNGSKRARKPTPKHSVSSKSYYSWVLVLALTVLLLLVFVVIAVVAME